MQKVKMLNMDQFQAYSVQNSPANVWLICEARVGWERLRKKKSKKEKELKVFELISK